MRKLLAGSIVLVALAAAPALAADMPPTKKPVAKEPPFVVYTWNGFYVGLQGGGGWSHVVQTDPRPFNSDAYQPNGGAIGGERGFNFAYKSSLCRPRHRDQRLHHRHRSPGGQLRRRAAALFFKSRIVCDFPRPSRVRNG